MPTLEASTEAPQIVNGQAESIPIQNADGNVKLAASAVVQPIVGVQQIAPNTNSQQVVVSVNPKEATTSGPVAIQPVLDKLGE